MKKIAGVALIMFMLSGLALAGTKEDLAAEVVKLTDIRKMSDQLVTQVMQRQVAQVKRLNIPKERQAEESAYQEKVKNKLVEAVSWEKLENEYRKSLAEVYTEEELKALITFSKTPAGQSILKKEPIIMGRIMMLMQSKLQSVLPEIRRMTRDFSESVKKVN